MTDCSCILTEVNFNFKIRLVLNLIPDKMHFSSNSESELKAGGAEVSKGQLETDCKFQYHNI